MPFEKGRQKTGGRQKGGPVRKATKFVDQLSAAGFNYVRELADVLKAIKELRNAPDLIKSAELKYFYTELKYLLPYMAPKLREKEVEVVEPTEPTTPEAALSTEDILKALRNGQETETHPRTSNPNPLGAGSSKLQVPSSTEEDLSNLAGEQEEDS